MGKYYGTAVKEPTGYGLPGYDPSIFGLAATLPAEVALQDIVWCEHEGGCPVGKCVDCKKEKA